MYFLLSVYLILGSFVFYFSYNDFIQNNVHPQRCIFTIVLLLVSLVISFCMVSFRLYYFFIDRYKGIQVRK